MLGLIAAFAPLAGERHGDQADDKRAFAVRFVRNDRRCARARAAAQAGANNDDLRPGAFGADFGGAFHGRSHRP